MAEGVREDAMQMRLRQAAEQKARKMAEFADMAKQPRKDSMVSEEIIRQRQSDATAEKQRQMDQLHEKAKLNSVITNTGSRILANAEGGTRVTTTTTTTSRQTNDGNTSFQTTQQMTTRVSGPRPPPEKSAAKGALEQFKKLEEANPVQGGKSNLLGVTGGVGGGPKVAVQRSPSTIKQMLLDWCKHMTQGYEHVDVKNFSTSWNDGMAFCALIHHFHPEAFDYSKLNPKNRRFNFQLAFDSAEKMADISPLLEVDDMVKMKNPDWKCVFTYVQMFYRKFHMMNKQAPKAAEGNDS